MNTKRLLSVVSCAVFAVSGSAQTLPANANPGAVTIIRAGNLVDPLSGQTKQNQLIVVRGNRIESVGDASSNVPPGAQVIDLSNATVLPGMIESHTHIFLQGEDP